MAIQLRAALEPVIGRAARRAQRVASNVSLPAWPADDLARAVYCVLGIPIDAVDMSSVIHRIDAAIAAGDRLFISTANLNFLVTSLSDQEFRGSLLRSDLCTADGMPIVWIARLLGMPVKTRVAGSDMFDALCVRVKSRVGVFFFGGAETVADSAAEALNRRRSALTCVGSMYPGHGTVADMSSDAVIDRINTSNAQFLVVALGAVKGQQWLCENIDRVSVPVRAHLGAVVNFCAGRVKRAPQLMRRVGLEWLWRIKEEPSLWRRYWRDGLALMNLLFTHALPLAALLRWQALAGAHREDLAIDTARDASSVTLALSGAAVAQNVELAVRHFRFAVNSGKESVVIDLSKIRFIDPRFFGLLLMLQKELGARNANLLISGASARIKRLFYLCQLDYLLDVPARVDLCRAA